MNKILHILPCLLWPTEEEWGYLRNVCCLQNPTLEQAESTDGNSCRNSIHLESRWDCALHFCISPLLPKEAIQTRVDSSNIRKLVDIRSGKSCHSWNLHPSSSQRRKTISLDQVLYLQAPGSSSWAAPGACCRQHTTQTQLQHIYVYIKINAEKLGRLNHIIVCSSKNLTSASWIREQDFACTLLQQ